MNEDDRTRLDRVEAKVDRILVILDDEDFGLRYRVKANTDGITSIKNQLYAFMTGFTLALVGVLFTAIR